MLENIYPYSEGQDYNQYVMDLARAVQYNFEQLNKFTKKTGVSGTLTIDLGAGGAAGRVAIEILNGIIVGETISATSAVGITWA